MRPLLDQYAYIAVGILGLAICGSSLARRPLLASGPGFHQACGGVDGSGYPGDFPD